MLQIGQAEYSRVVEDGGSVFEGDVMLEEVPGCFEVIPLELKLAVVQIGALFQSYRTPSPSAGKRKRALVT